MVSKRIKLCAFPSGFLSFANKWLFKHSIFTHKQLINISESKKIAIAKKMHKMGYAHYAEAEKIVQGTFSTDIS